MRIVWDPPKRLTNLKQHRLDFADFEDGFDWNNFLTLPAKPSRTGRKRAHLIGSLNGERFVVAVVSPLGSEALSLVSLRPASRKERKLYAER